MGVASAALAVAALAAGLIVSSILYLRADAARDHAESQAYVAALAAADAQIVAADSATRPRGLAGPEAERRLLAAPGAPAQLGVALPATENLIRAP